MRRERIISCFLSSYRARGNLIRNPGGANGGPEDMENQGKEDAENEDSTIGNPLVDIRVR